MKKFVKEYYSELHRLMSCVTATGKSGKIVDFSKAVVLAADLMQTRTAAGRKIIFIGNGASAAISSHQAADYWKNGGMRAVAFNDAALLTCVSNDIGYAHVFEKPVEMFADKGDVLVAISSSGQSENILMAVKAAASRGCALITLSGFKPENPLRKAGGINFYVPSCCYGPIEILHHSICHCILELILERTQARKKL